MSDGNPLITIKIPKKLYDQLVLVHRDALAALGPDAVEATVEELIVASLESTIEMLDTKIVAVLGSMIDEVEGKVVELEQKFKRVDPGTSDSCTVHTKTIPN